MKRVITAMLLCLMLCLSCAAAFANGTQAGVDEAQLQKLQNKMMGDPQIMAMITALQNDPDMMALLNDPVFIQAIQSRDVNRISSDPRFAKLLSKPAIREIIKRAEQ